MNLTEPHPDTTPRAPRFAIWPVMSITVLAVLLMGVNLNLGVTYIFAFLCLVALLARSELLLYGIVALVVLFVDGWTPTRSPEDVFFRMGVGRVYVMEFAVLALLIRLFLKRAFWPHNEPRSVLFASTPINPPLIAIALLLPAYAVYGIVRGSPFQDAAGYFEWRSLFWAVLFYFLTVRIIESRAQSLRLFRWFFALAATKALYSIILYFSGSEGIAPFLLGIGPVDEAPENLLYVFAALGGLSQLALSWKECEGKRLYLLAAIFILVANVLVSEKRTPQVCLIVGLAMLLWQTPFRQRLKWTAVVGAGLLVVMMFSGVFSSRSKEVGIAASASRYDEIAEFVREPSQILSVNGTLAFHLLDLADVLGVIMERPLLGHGFGSRYERQLTLLPGVGGEFAGLDTGMVHNQYLQLWWKMGLPGLLAFLWMAHCYWKFGYKLILSKLGSESGAIAFGLWVALWGELVSELWTATWTGTTKVPFLVFLSISLVVCLVRPEIGRDRKGSPQSLETRRRSIGSYGTRQASGAAR